MPSNVENKALQIWVVARVVIFCGRISSLATTNSSLCDAQETNCRSAKFSCKLFLSLLRLLKFSASGSRTHKGLTAEPAWQISGFFMSKADWFES